MRVVKHQCFSRHAQQVTQIRWLPLALSSDALHTCRRAFSRLLDRVLKVKEDLSQLKADKKELLRATYAAVRGDKTSDATVSAASDDAILGRDGAFRVSLLARGNAARSCQCIEGLLRLGRCLAAIPIGH